MTRFVPVTVLVVLLAASGGVAGAQNMLPGGATIQFDRRQIFDPTNKATPFFEPQAASKELFQYFNLAHCNCAKANQGMPNMMGTFNYRVTETQQSGVHSPVDYWAGTSCDDAMHRTGAAATCKQLASTPSNNDLDAELRPGGDFKNFNLYEVINGVQAGAPGDMSAMPCLQLDNANNSIYALVDQQAGGTNYDYFANQVVGRLNGETTMASGADTRPPPLPEGIVASGNEGEIDLSWKPPTSNATDIAFYQALCATVDGGTARSQSHAPRYVTTASLCGPTAASSDETPKVIPFNNGDEPVDAPAGALAALDAKYICGEQDAGTVTSLRIKGLRNGTPYRVVLVAIDLHGNFTAGALDHAITPVKSTDFWELLHSKDNNSHAEGGLCLLAETYGDDSALTGVLRAFRDHTLGGSRLGRWLTEAYYATLGRLGGLVRDSAPLRVIAAVLLAPLVALALLWHWIGLPAVLALVAAIWWYRRRRRAAARGAAPWRWLRAPAVACSAAVVLGAGPAHAGGYQPYWESSDPTDQQSKEVPPGDPSLVEWHAGIRIGPYVPDVDSQFTMSPKPFVQMFGGYHMLPMLDVDRILWTGFGQVGVGGSIGYWQKTARPFTDDADLKSPDPARQPGNKTAFRLIPLELSATYRLTMLDDNYGIPIVPYVRGGLAYYIWWITAPSGNYGRVCSDGGMEPNCAQNKALGASLGLQGAIGLSIRAERIDPSAAMSMQNSGVQHAGIYAELSLAKVDGFGSDTKLSVGDTTWFAGVDFEF